MRTSLSPYGGNSVPTDHLIGDAFPKLLVLYNNMDLLMAVGTAISGSQIGAPLLLQRRVSEQGSTGLLGATVAIPFTDMDITLSNIIASSVKVIGNDGALYFADSGYFTAKVISTGLSLKLHSDAPAALQNALVEWFITYGA